jgi:hypothetical protein
MYTGIEVVSTDLPRTYGHIEGITRTTVTVRRESGESSRYKLERLTTLPFRPVADHLILVPRETVKRDSRDMYPTLIKGDRYEAWDDGKVLVIKVGSGYLHLDNAEREGVLKLCDKNQEE